MDEVDWGSDEAGVKSRKEKSSLLTDLVGVQDQLTGLVPALGHIEAQLEIYFSLAHFVTLQFSFSQKSFQILRLLFASDGPWVFLH